MSEDEVESYLGEQVETLWALMWVLGKIKLLDFGTLCSDDLVKMLPDLLIQESTDRFCSQIQLRSSEEIVSMTDTAYCLHWSLRDAEVNRRKRPGSVAPHVVIERRRALEWLLTSTPWDEITLDT